MQTKQLFPLSALLPLALMAGAASAANALLPLPLRTADFTQRTVFDPRVRHYISPVRILWQTNLVEDAAQLLTVTNGQITLEAGRNCVLQNKGSAPGVLLDFGTELQGAVQIGVTRLKPANSENGKTARIRIRFGESAQEAMSEMGERFSQNDHAVRDQIVSAPWLGTIEAGQTGFRFVRLDLIDPGAELSLKWIRAVLIIRDLPYLGSFRCNDDRLNQIWRTGAYTVHLNMQDYLWDGIKRDRLVWVGDMHPETMTISSVFGAVDIVPRSLDLIRDRTPLPAWMNGISSYSIWWILIQHSWYQQQGDLEYLKNQKQYLRGLLHQLATYIDKDGRETLPEGRFLDWPSKNNQAAIHAGLQALLVLAFEAGNELAVALEDPALQQSCQAAVIRLRKHLPDAGNSKQAAALMALARLGEAEKINREILAVDGVQRLSTFYGYYVLQARAKANDYTGCLDTIRAYWGAMLDYGATTFWEDFSLDWTNNAARIDQLTAPGQRDIHGDFGDWCYKGYRHSLCHGWASGPTAWLSEHVLGVQVVAPGGKVVRIEPHLGDLEWVEGSFPTPQGVITVRHERLSNGKIKSHVQAPPGVKIVK
jgi:alpha-L-rhamnosidase